MHNAAVTKIAKAVASTVGTVSTTPLNGGAVDMSKYSRVDFVFNTGSLNASETADALVQSDTVSAFNDSPATVTGKATAAEALDDNQIAIISVRASELPDGDRYCRGQMTGSGATGGPACILALAYKRYESEDDGTPNVAGEVDQVVAFVE